MSWSRNEVTILIEEYRQWPNLYVVKSPNYKNRNMRTTALESIKASLKDLTNVTTTEVQSKFKSLKQNATKEYKKWKNSLKSGAGADEVSLPSLWYFDLISFIFDHTQPRQATDSMGSESGIETEDTQDVTLTQGQEFSNDDEMCQSDEEDHVERHTEVYDGIVNSDGLVSLESQVEVAASSSVSQTESDRPSKSTSYKRHFRSPERKKKRQKNDEAQLLQTVTGSLRNISENLFKSAAETIPPNIPQDQESKLTANEHFGQLVIEKLNRITVEDIRDDAEIEILRILNNARKKCI